jgi:hypothetical protein
MRYQEEGEGLVFCGYSYLAAWLVVTARLGRGTLGNWSLPRPGGLVGLLVYVLPTYLPRYLSIWLFRTSTYLATIDGSVFSLFFSEYIQRGYIKGNQEVQRTYSGWVPFYSMAFVDGRFV